MTAIIGDGKFLFSENPNMRLQVPVWDENELPITSGQTVEFSLFEVATQKYYNTATNAFDLAVEPSLISATQLLTPGVYEYVLTNAHTPGNTQYRLHLDMGGEVDFDNSAIPQTVHVDFDESFRTRALTALSSIPNVETDSLSDLTQLIAYIAKLGKDETLTLQRLFDESGVPFGQRTVDVTVTPAVFGKLT